MESSPDEESLRDALRTLARAPFTPETMTTIMGLVRGAGRSGSRAPRSRTTSVPGPGGMAQSPSWSTTASPGISERHICVIDVISPTMVADSPRS